MAVRQTRAAESIKNFYTQEKWYKHMCSALTVNTFGRSPLQSSKVPTLHLQCSITYLS